MLFSRSFNGLINFRSDTDKKVNQGWGANEGNAEFSVEEQAAADVVQDTSGWGADLDAGAPPAGDGWGTTDDVGADVKADTSAAAPANGTAGESRRANREEEEDNSLTLDEYLAQKNKQAVPKLESVRKANEGADESLWTDVVPINKQKEDDNYYIGKVSCSKLHTSSKC